MTPWRRRAVRRVSPLRRSASGRASGRRSSGASSGATTPPAAETSMRAVTSAASPATVGLDPEELIGEYDATQAPPQPITAADVFQPFTPVKLKERRRPNWSVCCSPGWSPCSASSGSGTSGSHNSPQHPGHREHVGGPAQPDEDDDRAVAHPSPQHVRLTLIALPGRVVGPADHVDRQGDLPGRRRAVAGILQEGVDARSTPSPCQLGQSGRRVHLYLNGKKQTYVTTTSITLRCTRRSARSRSAVAAARHREARPPCSAHVPRGHWRTGTGPLP